MFDSKLICSDLDILNTTTEMSQHIIYRPPGELKPYPHNARVHDEKQITVLMASIAEFGFRGAILVNENNVVLAGHARLEAAKRMVLNRVPTIVVEGLTKAQEKAFVLADNKLATMSKWDMDLLQYEIKMLVHDNFNLETTGFSTAEIDLMLDQPPETESDKHEDVYFEDIIGEPVSRPGDLYILGTHKLLCASSLHKESYDLLMNGELAQMVITDPPYNVKIDGHVCGTGNIKHDEFAMASGEMTESEFTNFLTKSFTLMKDFSQNGAIIYSFMDWRHQREILNAAQPIFGPLRQLCVWAKDNGGMGTFYRSQHELVYVFKNGDAKHINNFGLGQHGRYRTNLWSYPGANTFSGKELLKLHPTVKPCSMIADSLRDCSHRKGLILDPFAGSGTILIAAEKTGRYARAIELEPKYVDISIRRWERLTGNSAVHAASGLTFMELAELRSSEKE